jgi:hypothetical protein
MFWTGSTSVEQNGNSKLFTWTLLAEAFITTFHFRGHEHSIDMILTHIINNNNNNIIIIIVKYTHVQYLSWSSPHEGELRNASLFIIYYFTYLFKS